MKYLVDYKVGESHTYVLIEASCDGIFNWLLIEHLMYK